MSTINIKMSEVKERQPLPAGEYVFGIRGNPVLRLSKSGGHTLAVQLVPQGRDADSFTQWYSLHPAMLGNTGVDMSFKKFLDKLGFPGAAITGEVESELKIVSDKGQPVLLQHVKFKGKTKLRKNKETGDSMPQLAEIISRA